MKRDLLKSAVLGYLYNYWKVNKEYFNTTYSKQNVILADLFTKDVTDKISNENERKHLIKLASNIIESVKSVLAVELEGCNYDKCSFAIDEALYYSKYKYYSKMPYYIQEFVSNNTIGLNKDIIESAFSGVTLMAFQLLFEKEKLEYLLKQNKRYQMGYNMMQSMPISTAFDDNRLELVLKALDIISELLK